jgi:hypothetical protein
MLPEPSTELRQKIVNKVLELNPEAKTPIDVYKTGNSFAVTYRLNERYGTLSFDANGEPLSRNNLQP